MTADELRAFEERICGLFADGKIRAPVHLSGGNEHVLIDIFRRVQPEDWVLVGWRSHLHCLLKGVPPEELEAAILKGKSVALCFPAQKVLCSGICGGIAPIATGLAAGIKDRGGAGRVWCFLGDMTAEMGIVHEAMKYAASHDLPVKWVIEDNHRAVLTDTRAAWGDTSKAPDVMRYDYELKWPHVGIGKRVEF